jgi:hypothetical protein
LRICAAEKFEIGLPTMNTFMSLPGWTMKINERVSLNWNRFLFDICVGNLENLVVEGKYEDQHFGSWRIELADRRILYDGRDHWLISQFKKGDKWYDGCISTKEELTLSTYFSIIRSMR